MCKYVQDVWAAIRRRRMRKRYGNHRGGGARRDRNGGRRSGLRGVTQSLVTLFFFFLMISLARIRVTFWKRNVVCISYSPFVALLSSFYV